ncbi:hypothetical protein [Halohasta salina]|uniref:hypothetical protein n=1 Tax=Halohasta salina TaxID=2961621 RepID=UPI0020A52CBB|nr:hypothetical protein [Halohasta salina]
MSNDSSPVGGAHGFDSEALEEWVAETARQKGVSKQELLDEILSSYWVLEELSGVVTDSEVANEPRHGEGQPGMESGDRTAAGGGAADDDRSSTAEFSELKTELQGLRGAIEELSGDQRDTDADEAGNEELSALEGQLDDLSSAVVDRQTETDDTIDRLDNRLEAVDERLSTVERRLSEGMSLSELKAAVERTEADHAELERRLESEFDSIEQVLQHLLDTTDNIEYRLGAVSDARQEALAPIREQFAKQEELADLKQEAIRHGVEAADCDNCGQTIDLGLLEAPECPSCEQRFTGITKGGWLPFSNDKLQTTDRPIEPAGGQPGGTGPERQPTDRESGGPDYQTNW